MKNKANNNAGAIRFYTNAARMVFPIAFIHCWLAQYEYTTIVLQYIHTSVVLYVILYLRMA